MRRSRLHASDIVAAVQASTEALPCPSKVFVEAMKTDLVDVLASQANRKDMPIKERLVLVHVGRLSGVYPATRSTSRLGSQKFLRPRTAIKRRAKSMAYALRVIAY